MEIVISTPKKADKKFDSRIDGKKYSFIWSERGIILHQTYR